MNRLQRELQRLYAPQADASPGPDLVEPSSLVDAQGRVRAMVLDLARPANWAALRTVWGGVQADLALPAPAIAVNGSDGFQLWFSLLQPVPAPQAAAFLDALRRRYLGDIAPARVALLPALDVALDAVPAQPPQHARPVPALQADGTLWSAFVAPDLASMFADEPWIDAPPNLDGQAQLLASLKSILPADFQQALQQLKSAAGTAEVTAELTAEVTAAMTAAQTLAQTTAPRLTAQSAAQAASAPDPKRFLLDVMNNESLDLALRMEAAKALLPYFEVARGQPALADKLK